MRITVLCVGKLKEKYWKDACEEYLKRLSRFCTASVVEVREARLSEGASPAEEQAAVEEEGKNLLRRVEDGAFVVELAIKGKPLTSEALAGKLNDLALGGHSHVIFIIGGSLGLSPEVSRRADFSLSFSAMTFPHQMMRVILLEQVYRSFKILRNETYHK